MLRIALLAMVEPAGVGQARPRAFLRVGGKTLARHQLDLAIELGCERIICICRSVEPELIGLQHEAERADRLFHIVAGLPELSRLVAAGDELVVFEEGLLAYPQEAAKLVEGGQCVLVQPVESGVAAGFERLDLNNSAAGMVRVPGRLVEGLMELPRDYNVLSALTRLALQSGIPMREVPAAALSGVRWHLIRTEMEAYAIENDWLKLQLDGTSESSPGGIAARFGVLTFGPSLLHAGNAVRVAVIATVAVIAIGLGAGWLGQVAVGFLLCAVAWLLLEAARLLQRVEAGASGSGSQMQLRNRAIGWLLDFELVLLALWGSGGELWGGDFNLVFAPLILILLVRLVPRLLNQAWSGWVADRAVLSLLLGFAAAFGVVAELVRILALCLALTGLIVSPQKRG